MKPARRERLAKARAVRKEQAARLRKSRRWTIPCTLCEQPGPVGKMIRKPDIRICKTCWRTLSQSRKAAIVEAIDRL